MEERARGQDSREKEREQGRESKHTAAEDAASVVKLTVRKYTCFS